MSLFQTTSTQPLGGGKQGIDKATLTTYLARLSAAHAGLKSDIIKIKHSTGKHREQAVNAVRAQAYLIHGHGGNQASLNHASRLMRTPLHHLPGKDATAGIVTSLGHHNLRRENLLEIANCQLPPDDWVTDVAKSVSSNNAFKTPPTFNFGSADIRQLCNTDPFPEPFPKKVALDLASRQGKAISDNLSGQPRNLIDSYRARRFFLDTPSLNAFKSMPFHKDQDSYVNSKPGNVMIPAAPAYVPALTKAILPLLKADDDGKQILDKIWDTATNNPDDTPEVEEYMAILEFVKYIKRAFTNGQLPYEESVLEGALGATLRNGSKFLPYGPMCIIRLLSTHQAPAMEFGTPATTMPYQGVSFGTSAPGVGGPTTTSGDMGAQNTAVPAPVANNLSTATVDKTIHNTFGTGSTTVTTTPPPQGNAQPHTSGRGNNQIGGSSSSNSSPPMPSPKSTKAGRSVQQTAVAPTAPVVSAPQSVTQVPAAVKAAPPQQAKQVPSAPPKVSGQSSASTAAPLSAQAPSSTPQVRAGVSLQPAPAGPPPKPPPPTPVAVRGVGHENVRAYWFLAGNLMAIGAVVSLFAVVWYRLLLLLTSLDVNTFSPSNGKSG